MSDLEHMATRFIHQAAGVWERAGLPPRALANAAAVWGLNVASAEATPAEVAEGLQRIADEIMTVSPSLKKDLQ